jgi:pimeloyl-ACP methyl ester carboxylesterase
MTSVVLTIVLTPAAAVFVWQVIGGLIAYKLIHSNHHRISHSQTPHQFGLRVTDLTIPVDARHNLAGWMLTPQSNVSLGGACVVMVHGFSGGKDKLWQFAEGDYQASTLEQGALSLVEAGFYVVAIDLRNHGASDDNGPVTLGARESHDVLATIDYLQTHAATLGIDRDRIGLRGESMGGATCLIAAAHDSTGSIRAIWSDSAFADASTAMADFMRYKKIPSIFSVPARQWLTRLSGVRLEQASPLHHIGSIECPVFLTHSDGDRMLPIRHWQFLCSSPDWQQPPQAWQLTAHAHNRLWREPKYHQRQVEFFHQHLVADRIAYREAG